MKRPSDPSSPTPKSKYARQEIQSPDLVKLQHLHEDLLWASITPKSTNDGLDSSLNKVYSAVHSVIASLDDVIQFDKLVKKDVFKVNVPKQREQFLQLLRQVVQKTFVENDVHALITHSMCTYPWMTLIMNIFQVHSGLVCHLIWSVRLPNLFVHCNNLIMSSSFAQVSSMEHFWGVAA